MLYSFFIHPHSVCAALISRDVDDIVEFLYRIGRDRDVKYIASRRLPGFLRRQDARALRQHNFLRAVLADQRPPTSPVVRT